MSRLFTPFVVITLGLTAGGPGPATDDLVRKLEAEMKARPEEAFVIARRGADQLAGNPEPINRLLRSAARTQKDILPRLTRDQVAELADVYAKQLDDPASSDQVKRRWLRLHDDALQAGDARGRVDLARLVLRWCGDRDWAARLCREAYDLDHDLTAANDLLRDKLNYQLTDRGWVPRPPVEREWKQRVQAVHRGMSQPDVRDLLGPPNRVGRQILYKRYLEQWTYDNSSPVVIEFDCTKGRDAHVLNVHQTVSPRP